MAGLEAQRAAIGGLSLVTPIQRRQGGRQAAAGVERIRLVVKGMLERSRCVGVLPLPLKNGTEEQPRLGVRRLSIEVLAVQMFGADQVSTALRGAGLVEQGSRKRHGC